MSATMSEDKFLSNDKNKQRLINRLCVKFQKEGFVVKQAEEDAYCLIIKSALEIEKGSQCVVIVSEDVELLDIMAAPTNSENIFFLNPGREMRPRDHVYLSANCIPIPSHPNSHRLASRRVVSQSSSDSSVDITLHMC
ncbi:hypothetical protein AVEN_46759-1 [Araneus ventricosus]|uniref:Uncharacterized protein n=1 Tax=Araneus ventricosus TaxID=182803 RepID=A0A4Y2LXR2_ARAVE|nr:hypothetical protein AVEN_46759-1 [Araneus ventricosus]